MFHRTLLMFAAASMFATGIPPAIADQPRIDLRPRFAAGQENRFVVDMLSRTESQLLDDSLVKIEQYRQRLRMKRRVVSADESGATLELTYEAVAVNLTAGGRSVYFDTEWMNDAEAEEALGEGVRNAVARTFTVVVDPLGRVQSVAGNEQDGTKVASANLIGDDLFKRSLLPMYGLGKEPAATAVGESWEIVRRPPPTQTGQFVHTMTVTLESFDPVSGRASVRILGSTALEPSEKARQAKAEVTRQSITGEQVWSVLDGACDRSVFRQAMQIRAEVEVTNFNTRESRVRPRRVDTLLHVVVQRIDEGLAPLPPLDGELSMPPLEPPSAPVPPIPAQADPAPPPSGH